MPLPELRKGTPGILGVSGFRILQTGPDGSPELLGGHFVRIHTVRRFGQRNGKGNAPGQCDLP